MKILPVGAKIFHADRRTDMTKLTVVFRNLQACTDTEDFQETEDPRFPDSRNINVMRLSALRTGRFYSPGYIPGIHFCYRLSRPQGHSAAGRIRSIKNSSETVGIEPATFGLVAKYHNQLRHLVPSKM